MAGVNSRFAISKAEIMKIQEDAVPENTKKAAKSVFEMFLRSLSEAAIYLDFKE